jgi:pimeloyl-ACP methyl ester carboxylesterase
MPLPNPVIVVPAIIATYLRDLYPIPPETVWSVLTTAYERAALHPDDLGDKVAAHQRVFEAAEPAKIVPDEAYEIIYKELVEELRFNLRAKEDEPVPVFVFGYDWRQPLETIEDELAGFVDEVIRRTALLRHYFRAGYADSPKVNLVGHSMGGLVIAGYFGRYGGTHKVGKVATLGSPFQGSFETVVKITTGTSNLGTTPPSSREREAARMTPALYYLVPSFAAGLKIDAGLPQTNLFDQQLWQPSIIDTIAEYIRLYGRDPAKSLAQRREMARQLFSAMLAAAQTHRARLDGLNLAGAGLSATEDWLAVIGVNATTRVRLRITRNGASPEFAFDPADRADDWKPGGDSHVTGDGTVPFEGAIPKFLPYEVLVCVTPDDFDYWEVPDKLTLKVAGFHGMLPTIDMVQRMVVRHFTGRADARKNTWGLPAPGVTTANWKPPLPLAPRS